MDYLKKIITEAKQATYDEFAKDMELFLQKHNQVNEFDPFKALAQTLVTLQTQNTRILYRVLNQLSQDGYLVLPKTDEPCDE